MPRKRSPKRKRRSKKRHRRTAPRMKRTKRAKGRPPKRRRSPSPIQRRRSPRRSRRRSPRRSRRRSILKGRGCTQPRNDDLRTVAYGYRKIWDAWPPSWNPCTNCECINLVRKNGGILMTKGFKKDCLMCAEDYLNAYKDVFRGTPGEEAARKRAEKAVTMAERADRLYDSQVVKDAYWDHDPTD